MNAWRTFRCGWVHSANCKTLHSAEGFPNLSLLCTQLLDQMAEFVGIQIWRSVLFRSLGDQIFFEALLTLIPVSKLTIVVIITLHGLWSLKISLYDVQDGPRPSQAKDRRRAQGQHSCRNSRYSGRNVGENDGKCCKKGTIRHQRQRRPFERYHIQQVKKQ